MQSILERPQVQLMHRPIVQVRADRGIHADDLPVGFLFVRNKVLHACDGGLLHAADCFEHELPVKIRVVCEAFPIA